MGLCCGEYTRPAVLQAHQVDAVSSPLLPMRGCPLSLGVALQVGMQNSALAGVLAGLHFPAQPMTVVPCVLSACTHATLGSLLAGYWAGKADTQDAASGGSRSKM